MIKKIMAIFTVALIIMTLVSCDKKGTCEICKTKNVVVKALSNNGEEALLCDNCYNRANSLLTLK